MAWEVKASGVVLSTPHCFPPPLKKSSADWSVQILNIKYTSRKVTLYFSADANNLLYCQGWFFRFFLVFLSWLHGQFVFQDEPATSTMINNQRFSHNYCGGCVIMWILVRLLIFFSFLFVTLCNFLFIFFFNLLFTWSCIYSLFLKYAT